MIGSPSLSPSISLQVGQWITFRKSLGWLRYLIKTWSFFDNNHRRTNCSAGRPQKVTVLLQRRWGGGEGGKALNKQWVILPTMAWSWWFRLRAAGLEPPLTTFCSWTLWLISGPAAMPSTLVRPSAWSQLWFRSDPLLYFWDIHHTLSCYMNSTNM